MDFKLLSPGIVRSDKKVLDALSFQHTFMHRDDEFHEMYFEIDKKLKHMVCSNPNDFITLLVTGSGTSSMDEVINALVGHGKTLFLTNGLFGERWISIGKFYNEENVVVYDSGWGTPFNLDDIISMIEAHDIEHVVAVQCDTSVGILNPIYSIGSAIKKVNPNIVFVVDTVSSFGVVDNNMERGNIDILVTNPNKAIASHMGLGMIIGRHDVFQRFEVSKCGSYSLNMARHYSLAIKGETCNSVSISCINALNMAITNYKQHDYELLFNHTYNLGKKHGFKTLIDKEHSCKAIITFLSDNADEILVKCRKHGFVVYPCKGHLEHKGFQISFYGADGTIENINQLFEIIHQ